MYTILEKYKKFEIKKSQLQDKLGQDLYNVEIESPVEVRAEDVIQAIVKYSNNDINQQELLNWVNVIWFTDLFVYEEVHEDSISSVIEILEQLDESDFELTKEDWEKIIYCLRNNIEYNK